MFVRRLFLTCLGAMLFSSSAQQLAGEGAQWDLDGDLESITGNSPLVPLAASPALDP